MIKELFPCFFGLFKVLQRIGKMVYKLERPSTSKLHLAFLVSLLKALPLQQGISQSLPPLGHGVPLPIPKAQLNSCRNQGQLEVLINWEGLSPADASWELSDQMALHYPDFALEDKHHLDYK